MCRLVWNGVSLPIVLGGRSNCSWMTPFISLFFPPFISSFRRKLGTETLTVWDVKWFSQTLLAVLHLSGYFEIPQLQCSLRYVKKLGLMVDCLQLGIGLCGWRIQLVIHFRSGCQLWAWGIQAAIYLRASKSFLQPYLVLHQSCCLKSWSL